MKSFPSNMELVIQTTNKNLNICVPSL
uniref:Uncharacterized protein n=1 Tax=Lepeophtheirus salmonis TaxID=72036 RepID=A0A0K2T2Q4_LEPSM